MLKNAIKIALGIKNCIPKIWRFFWKKLCTFLVAYVRKNVCINRAKRFLENSSFLVRVTIYFLVPHKEFKTEKILLPTVDKDGDFAIFIIIIWNWRWMLSRLLLIIFWKELSWFYFTRRDDLIWTKETWSVITI